MPKRAKQVLLKMIESMPKQVPAEDMTYEFYVRQRVDRERKELTVGKTISHEQVKRGYREVVQIRWAWSPEKPAWTRSHLRVP